MVKALVGPNHKYINSVYNAIGGVSTIGTPYLICLNAVAQGTSENTRIGRLCRHKWLDLDFTIFQTTTLDTSSVRAYVVVETTALGSNLSPSQFFVDASAFTPTSQRDRTNRNASRFVVLWDSGPHVIGPFSLASGQTAPAVIGAGQPAQRSWSKHIPLNFTTDYSRGNGGTISDIDTNSLFLMIVTDQTAGTAVGLDGGFTVCFSDDS
jgi:hypothetical protein